MLRLDRLSFPVQFGGAVGTLEGWRARARRCGRRWPPNSALRIRRSGIARAHVIADLGHLLALITGSLGKMGQDIALLAQAGDDITLSSGGGSSAMPHKQNPVAAETLVALARFNAVQASALQQAMVHEQERSGAAWTLEWLTLPHMLAATGAALRHAEALTLSILRLGGADDTRPG